MSSTALSPLKSPSAPRRARCHVPVIGQDRGVRVVDIAVAVSVARVRRSSTGASDP